MNYVNPRYARDDDYRAQLDEILASGLCPFCPEHFRWHPHPIIRETTWWRLTMIRENYPNARKHWLLIANRHITHLNELTADEWQDLGAALAWVTGSYEISGGGIAMRFGPTDMTGSSVAHLHMHLIEPEVDNETGQAIPVMFPFG